MKTRLIRFASKHVFTLDDSLSNEVFEQHGQWAAHCSKDESFVVIVNV